MTAASPEPVTDKPTGQTSSSGLKDLVALVVGVLAIFALGVMIAYLVRRAGTQTTELTWGRLIYLLNGVEAIAYAAAGFLFGREVNRARAEKAEEARDDAMTTAEEARETAADARVKATKAETAHETAGRAIKTALQAKKVSNQSDRGATYGTLGPEDVTTLVVSDYQELLALAESLFPESPTA